jgi:CheY-like chemotaxis protein
LKEEADPLLTLSPSQPKNYSYPTTPQMVEGINMSARERKFVEEKSSIRLPPLEPTTPNVSKPSGAFFRESHDWPAAAPPKKGHSILLVDDSIVTAKILSKFFRDNGYTVRVCGNAGSALQLLGGDTSAIDLIIFDIVLPTMNGFSFIERVRQELKVNVPAIAISTSTVEIDKAKRIDFIDAVLEKPCSRTEIIQLVGSSVIAHTLLFIHTVRLQSALSSSIILSVFLFLILFVYILLCFFLFYQKISF